MTVKNLEKLKNNFDYCRETAHKSKKLVQKSKEFGDIGPLLLVAYLGDDIDKLNLNFLNFEEAFNFDYTADDQSIIMTKRKYKHLKKVTDACMEAVPMLNEGFQFFRNISGENII